MSDVNPDSGLNRACETLPNPTEPHGTPERRSLAARRAAPRRVAPRSSSRVRGRRPPRPPGTHSSHQRATPRAYHLRKTGGWRRPHSRPSEGSSCAAVAAARAALVPGGEARTTASDRQARRGARRAESPSDHRVPLWRALRPSRGAAEDRTVRGARAAGGRRADEPAAREGAWPRRAQARSRGQALWSLGAARGGARPREHTQAVVSRRRSPLRSAAEWAGRETTSSRPTAWCRAALEPRRSARTPPGRRPSQPPASRLSRTGSGPLARLRTARAAGCGGGRSAGLGESARHAECGRCRLVIRLQLCRARSVFILGCERDFLNV